MRINPEDVGEKVMQKSEYIRSIYFHIHLVSDSTGETLVAISHASCAQFSYGIPVEHMHTLVRSESQLERALDLIEGYPGVVFYTLVNEERRRVLEKRCARLNILAIPILDQALASLGRYLGESVSSEIGAQRIMNEEYFSRISALDFAIAHDDGKNIDGLVKADIVILGISRTSKTPTCIYLANRGFRVGNVPLVPGAELSKRITNLKNPLIVGLVSSLERIIEVRKQRVSGLGQREVTDYIDKEQVRAELLTARRLYSKHKWPIIDTSRRSIEETATRIINLYQDHKNRS